MLGYRLVVVGPGGGRQRQGEQQGGRAEHQSDRRKRISAAQSSGGIAATRSRAPRLAAMPENGLDQAARPAVMQKARLAAHRLGKADALERGRAPFGAGDTPLGPTVGRPGPMSCSRKSL